MYRGVDHTVPIEVDILEEVIPCIGIAVDDFKLSRVDEAAAVLVQQLEQEVNVRQQSIHALI